MNSNTQVLEFGALVIERDTLKASNAQAAAEGAK